MGTAISVCHAPNTLTLKFLVINVCAIPCLVCMSRRIIRTCFFYLFNPTFLVLWATNSRPYLIITITPLAYFSCPYIDRGTEAIGTAAPMQHIWCTWLLFFLQELHKINLFSLGLLNYVEQFNFKKIIKVIWVRLIKESLLTELYRWLILKKATPHYIH